MTNQSRRDFIQFLGGLGALSLAQTACTPFFDSKNTKQSLLPEFVGLKPTNADSLVLAPGFEQQLLITEGTPLGQGLYFGCNNDFTQFIESSKNPGTYYLWVNHEYFSSVLFSNRMRHEGPTKDQYLKERETVGGSLIRIEQDSKGQWRFLGPHADNKRLSGSSKIPFTHPINEDAFAIGSFANCSGGHTPWNTILTCEENYDDYYGEWFATDEPKGEVRQTRRSYNWSVIEKKDPRHYGWVVEFDPETGKSKKLIGLGRFAHECAKVVTTKGGRCVVYTGDDRDDECLYKFIAAKKGSLDEGELFVASIEKQAWLSLDINKQPALKKRFKNQTEVLTHCREASKIIGGTPLARPEDIEQDPISKDIFIALTNNKPKGDLHGSILKIKEQGQDPLSLKFVSETFLTGGIDSGLSCPDNMAFDQKGNLWITCDISGTALNKGPYKAFGNNGLYVIPRRGTQAGELIQVASAPNDAELTGPCFSPDYKTLFLSVQHPGELSRNGKYTSHWPNGDGKKPLSSVITITGEKLQALTT